MTQTNENGLEEVKKKIPGPGTVVAGTNHPLVERLTRMQSKRRKVREYEEKKKGRTKRCTSYLLIHGLATRLYTRAEVTRIFRLY